MALVPDDPWGAYGLGVALWRTGRAESDARLLRRGEESLVRALELKPGDEPAQRELALVRALLQDPGAGK